MTDETIVPARYRTGRGDRSIPLALGLVLAGSAPLLGWWAGPLFWPWGLAAAAAAGLGAAGALVKWWSARGTVLWSETEGKIEFRRGKRSRTVDVASLIRVEVTPSSARARLWTEAGRHRLSLRLVRAEVLLEKLRQLRPDLFPQPEDRLVLRRSSTPAVLQVLLAAGTGAAGLILSGWQPAVGLFFWAAAAYVTVRVLFFIPRAYELSPGVLTTRYWLRSRKWSQLQSIREEGYAAGGAVFFRMVLEYGPWKVVLDEGQLRDPLRPRASLVIRLLLGPPLR